jgi:two-component system chemotaxis response regulator CheY
MAKIAIFVDEASIIQLYELKLKNAGHEVRTATNGQEGLTVLEKFRPDLILLDLRMPVMEGLEMLKMLHSQYWVKPAQIIILTNIGKEEAPQELKQLGVRQYLVKADYTPQQVVDIVNQTLNHYKK